MAEAQRGGAGLLDLEKELVCSICTELLYQPLTLLDCLHTFCGSCLKEWFSWQAVRTRSSHSLRFTCPSCRAVVRETRPNATVTTLLDMFLKANPDRAKPAEEMEEIAQKYKPGDTVLPAINSEGTSTDSDEEDRRLVEEVRELSLQDVDDRQRTRTANSRDAQSSRHRRATSADAGERTDDSRTRRRREEERRARRQAQQQAARTAVHAGSMAAASTSSRQIEHQSSLRSLLSSSDVESMEEEILRQIIEDGLLDGIDLHDLDQAQEEELSERIAEAYRRRHLQRSNPRPRRSTASEQPQESSRQRARSQTAQTQSSSTSQRESSRHPPVSRPHLFEPLSPPSVPGHQRRASDQGSRRRRTSPAPANPASSSETTLRPASRSATDTTDQDGQLSYSVRSRTRQPSISSSRRATEPEGRISDAWISGNRDRSNPQPFITRSASDPPAETQRPQVLRPDLVVPELAPPSSRGDGISNRNARSRPSSSRSEAPQPPAVLYPEPSISCDRCGKPDIQYDLYKNCPKCTGGKYNLCLRCYRMGRGCLHWFGFGSTAQSNFERMLSSSAQTGPVQETPHVLCSRRYRKPTDAAERTVNEGRQMTSDDPSKRLQGGVFCDTCHSLADDCFWKCGQCNYGEWGFCNSCVNQGRCCTHPLLPIRRVSNDNNSSASETQTNLSKSTSTPINSNTISINNDTYNILSFSTKCDICNYPIAPSSSRFHCLQCNDGDYDICTNCYLKTVACGKISKENGHNGWRRCLKGHRMIVVGFQDHEDGPHRVIVRGLVGGHALKDEHVRRRGSEHSSGSATSPELNTGDWSWKDGTEGRKKVSRVRAALANAVNGSGDSPVSSPTTAHGGSSSRRFPPDGGVGLIVYALWTWYPEEEAQDELLFPGGAEITEAENINDDWFWGCYAGKTGLFPGNYGRIIGEVT